MNFVQEAPDSGPEDGGTCKNYIEPDQKQYPVVLGTIPENITSFIDNIGVKDGPIFLSLICDDTFEMKLFRDKLSTLMMFYWYFEHSSPLKYIDTFHSNTLYFSHLLLRFGSRCSLLKGCMSISSIIRNTSVVETSTTPTRELFNNEGGSPAPVFSNLALRYSIPPLLKHNYGLILTSVLQTLLAPKLQFVTSKE